MRCASPLVAPAPKRRPPQAAHSLSRLDAAVFSAEAHRPAPDEEEASADNQSGHASLLHPWQGSCDARTIEFRATRQRLCRGIVSDPSEVVG